MGFSHEDDFIVIGPLSHVMIQCLSLLFHRMSDTIHYCCHSTASFICLYITWDMLCLWHNDQKQIFFSSTEYMTKVVSSPRRVLSVAPPVNRTRGPTMATLDFTTKPVVHANGAFSTGRRYLNASKVKIALCSREAVETGKIVSCTTRESNTGPNDGNVGFYH